MEYVSDMNSTNLPTSCFEVSRNIQECNILSETSWLNNDPDPANLGAKKYTLLAWMPSISCFHGVGGNGAISSADKLGGFVIAQEDNTYI